MKAKGEDASKGQAELRMESTAGRDTVGWGLGGGSAGSETETRDVGPG